MTTAFVRPRPFASVALLAVATAGTAFAQSTPRTAVTYPVTHTVDSVEHYGSVVHPGALPLARGPQLSRDRAVGHRRERRHGVLPLHAATSRTTSRPHHRALELSARLRPALAGRGVLLLAQHRSPAPERHLRAEDARRPRAPRARSQHPLARRHASRSPASSRPPTALRCAYGQSEGGSDWSTYYVRDLAHRARDRRQHPLGEVLRPLVDARRTRLLLRPLPGAAPPAWRSATRCATRRSTITSSAPVRPRIA